MVIYIKHCILLHIINKYWTVSCLYPCSDDTILHKNPTIVLYTLTPLSSHRYTATCFSPQRAVLREYWHIAWVSQQNACPDVNNRLKSSVLCVTWQMSNSDGCNITKVGLKVSVLLNCASCDLREQGCKYRLLSASIDFYLLLLLSITIDGNLSKASRNAVSKVSRPSRQVSVVRFQPNFNFLFRFYY
jgi:hypothetical protein